MLHSYSASQPQLQSHPPLKNIHTLIAVRPAPQHLAASLGLQLPLNSHRNCSFCLFLYGSGSWSRGSACPHPLSHAIGYRCLNGFQNLVPRTVGLPKQNGSDSSSIDPNLNSFAQQFIRSTWPSHKAGVVQNPTQTQLLDQHAPQFSHLSSITMFPKPMLMTF